MRIRHSYSHQIAIFRGKKAKVCQGLAARTWRCCPAKCEETLRCRENGYHHDIMVHKIPWIWNNDGCVPNSKRWIINGPLMAIGFSEWKGLAKFCTAMLDSGMSENWNCLHFLCFFFFLCVSEMRNLRRFVFLSVETHLVRASWMFGEPGASMFKSPVGWYPLVI